LSSRRRHTRFSRDWSSDVCSSDLTAKSRSTQAPAGHSPAWCSKRLTSSMANKVLCVCSAASYTPTQPCLTHAPTKRNALAKCTRSEERRVGTDSALRTLQLEHKH